MQTRARRARMACVRPPDARLEELQVWQMAPGGLAEKRLLLAPSNNSMPVYWSRKEIGGLNSGGFVHRGWAFAAFDEPADVWLAQATQTII